MPDGKHDITELEKGDKHITPGVGADLFIRKKLPGAQIGRGYIIDVYENGVKMDTQEVPTKKEVTELIRVFKDKYRTDRAFQNELQVHITYKTKEERGEVPEKAPEEKGKIPEIALEKEKELEKAIPPVEEVKKTKEERPMASIDNILMKQASSINGLILRLLNPELPIKVRNAEEPVIPGPLETVSSVPATPATEKGYDNIEQVKAYIVNEIITKFATFVSNRIKDAGGIEVKIDDLYNPLKGWYGALGRAIEDWNRMSKGAFVKQDIEDIVVETEKILLSKDPTLISNKSGVQVDQRVADLMYEVGSKSVGQKGDAEQGGELGGDPATSRKASEDEGEKYEPTEEDKLYEFTRQIQINGIMEPIEAIAQNLNLKDSSMLMSFYKILNKKSALNESETIAKRWIEEELHNKKQEVEKYESHVKDFWKYAETIEGEMQIDEAFLSWLPDNKFSSMDVQEIWNRVYDDVVNVFFKKEAALYLSSSVIESLFPGTMSAIGETITTAVAEGVDLNSFKDMIDQSGLIQTMLSEASGIVLQNGLAIASRFIEAGKGESESEIVEKVQHAAEHSNVVQGITSFLQSYFGDLYKAGKREYRAYLMEVMNQIKNALDQNWDAITAEFETNIRQHIREATGTSEEAPAEETPAEAVPTEVPTEGVRV